jgi:hypothetical protein
MRSASTPACGVRNTAGNNDAIDANPSHVELPVMSYNSAGTATICIQPPPFEMAAAVQNNAKSR